jgi:beta-glucosidase
MDRTFSLPLLQNTMIRNLAALNQRTLLAITAGGNVDMNPWIDRIPALLYLWYPGEEGGKAVADILFGVQNPEGKLPDSFAKSWEDSPTFHSYYPQDKSAAEPHIRYTEGVFLGYRFYDTPAVDSTGVQPRFPFGFGLSYTTFAFSDLRLSRSTMRANDPLTVSLTVRNTGKVAGAEVAQLYVGEQNPAVTRPHHELKAFQKVYLAPGETRTITLPLDRRSFAYWSEKEHAWKVDAGTFTIYAGDSSVDLPLHVGLTMQ